LCEGLEATLEVVAARVRLLTAAVERRKQEGATIARLAQLLTALSAGEPVGLDAFGVLAEGLLNDAQECGPLRFLKGDPGRPDFFVACHSLNVARVAARVVRHDPELKARPHDAVLAALLHDCGMLQVPAAALAHAGPFDDGQRRAVEGHCHAGAALLTRL